MPWEEEETDLGINNGKAKKTDFCSPVWEEEIVIKDVEIRKSMIAFQGNRVFCK